MATATNPERPTYVMHGQIVPVPDDVYEAWLAAGAPTTLPQPEATDDAD